MEVIGSEPVVKTWQDIGQEHTLFSGYLSFANKCALQNAFLIMKSTNENLSFSEVLEYFVWPCWTLNFHYCFSYGNVHSFVLHEGQRTAKKSAGMKSDSPAERGPHCFPRQRGGSEVFFGPSGQGLLDPSRVTQSIPESFLTISSPTQFPELKLCSLQVTLLKKRFLTKMWQSFAGCLLQYDAMSQTYH